MACKSAQTNFTQNFFDGGLLANKKPRDHYFTYQVILDRSRFEGRFKNSRFLAIVSNATAIAIARALIAGAITSG